MNLILAVGSVSTHGSGGSTGSVLEGFIVAGFAPTVPSFTADRLEVPLGSCCAAALGDRPGPHRRSHTPYDLCRHEVDGEARPPDLPF